MITLQRIGFVKPIILNVKNIAKPVNYQFGANHLLAPANDKPQKFLHPSNRLDHRAIAGAYALALEVHGAQPMKYDPARSYMTHINAVLAAFTRYAPVKPGTFLIEQPSLLCPKGVTYSQGCVATILHDSFEDGPKYNPPALQRIKRRYPEGSTVNTLIKYVSHLNKPEKYHVQSTNAFFDQIFSGPQTSTLIAGCDKLVGIRQFTNDLRHIRKVAETEAKPDNLDAEAIELLIKKQFNANFNVNSIQDKLEYYKLFIDRFENYSKATSLFTDLTHDLKKAYGSFKQETIKSKPFLYRIFDNLRDFAESTKANII